MSARRKTVFRKPCPWRSSICGAWRVQTVSAPGWQAWHCGFVTGGYITGRARRGRSRRCSADACFPNRWTGPRPLRQRSSKPSWARGCAERARLTVTTFGDCVHMLTERSRFVTKLMRLAHGSFEHRQDHLALDCPGGQSARDAAAGHQEEDQRRHDDHDPGSHAPAPLDRVARATLEEQRQPGR